MKKKACGGDIKKNQKGGSVQTVKTVTTYPNRLEGQRREVQYFNDGTQAVRNGGWGPDGMYRASYRGRQGEFGNTAGNPREQQVADSLQRVDWRTDGMNTVPVIKKQGGGDIKKAQAGTNLPTAEPASQRYKGGAGATPTSYIPG